MIMQAMLQNEAARRRREIQALRRAEAYERGPIISLIVRKTTAIFVTVKFCCVHTNGKSISPNRSASAFVGTSGNLQIFWLVPIWDVLLYLWLGCAGKSARGHTTLDLLFLEFADLLRKIALVSHIFDLLHLGFEKIYVIFFIF
jgi:hypothetical protein